MREVRDGCDMYEDASEKREKWEGQLARVSRGCVLNMYTACQETGMTSRCQGMR